MKKWLLVLMAVILFFALPACGSKSEKLSTELGVDVSNGREISSQDSHGAMGDGVSHIVFSFSDHAVLEQIKENSEWKPFPLDETVQALVYGASDGAGSIGPFLNDGNGNPLVPEIQNGYYLLLDRNTDKGTDILNRGSFNFTLGLYDTDTNTLHYCQLDT